MNNNLTDRSNLKSLFARLRSKNIKDKELFKLKKEINEIIYEYEAKYGITLSTSQALYIIDFNIEYKQLFCEICGKLKAYGNYNIGFYNTCGNSKCSNKLQKNKEARKKGCLKKYGVDSYFQTKLFKEARSNANIDYNEIKLKREETNLLKYGSKNSMNNKDLVSKNINSNIKHSWNHYLKSFKSQYCKPLFSYEEYLENYSINQFSFLCLHCNGEFKSKLQKNTNRKYKCPKCSPPFKSSKEQEIIQYLIGLGINEKDIIQNSRKIIKPYELDIYLPKYRLAIEYNGLMFHSFGKSKYSMYNNCEKEEQLKDKHFLKTNLCESKGINLLQINENERSDSTKQNIWKSIISKAVKKSEIIDSKEIYISFFLDKKQVNLFVEENGLKKLYLKGENIALFSKKNSKIIQLINFEQNKALKRIIIKGIIDLKFKTVKDSISLILNYFEETFGKYTISFELDRRFEGDLIKNILNKGFKQYKLDKPSSLYFKNNRLDTLIEREELNFGERKLEDRELYSLNYRKVYDAGKSSYISC